MQSQPQIEPQNGVSARGSGHPTIQAIHEDVKRHSGWVVPLQQEIARVIVGQHYLVERLLVGLLTSGHLPIEGVPVTTSSIQSARRVTPAHTASGSRSTSSTGRRPAPRSSARRIAIRSADRAARTAASRRPALPTLRRTAVVPTPTPAPRAVAPGRASTSVAHPGNRMRRASAGSPRLQACCASSARVTPAGGRGGSGRTAGAHATRTSVQPQGPTLDRADPLLAPPRIG